MAKGQKKGNREAKKPKTAGKKLAPASASPFQLPAKTATPGKNSSK